MSITTDPVKEFTDLCQRLRTSSSETGANFLAQQFDVSPWSTDFMLILATIHQRISRINEMIDETDLDDDIKQQAQSCLENVRQAFSLSGLANQWTHSVQAYLIDTNLLTIRMAHGYVRPLHGYTVPQGAELDELLSLVDDLLVWLNDHELSERDFIRAALVEGVTAFKFRIQRVGWFGWPDTFDSLKAIVAAYMALERGRPSANESPPHELFIKKTRELLEAVFSKVQFVKDVQETGDWLLRGYGAIHLAGTVQPTLAGLLSGPT